MKKRTDPSAIPRNKASFHYILPVLGGIVLLLMVLAALLLNTADMNRQLQKNTESYANDVSAQLASNISSRMNMRETYIRNLADTFSRSPKTILTEELLERKAEYLEMDMIFLLNSDGTTFPSGAAAAHPELDAYRQEHPDIYKNAHIFHSAHSEVFSQLRFSGGTEDRLLSWWVRAPAKCSRRCSRKWILRTRA